jgi:flagellar motor switch protein FliM
MSSLVLSVHQSIRDIRSSSIPRQHRRGIRTYDFKELNEHIKQTIKSVESNWDELAQEERDSLLNFAHSILNIESSRSEQNALKKSLPSFKIMIFFAWVVLRNQVDELFEVVDLCRTLADVVFEAHEKSEEDTTAKYLDFLMQGTEDPASLALYTKERDLELENLLAGVEID